MAKSPLQKSPFCEMTGQSHGMLGDYQSVCSQRQEVSRGETKVLGGILPADNLKTLMELNFKDCPS